MHLLARADLRHNKKKSTVVSIISQTHSSSPLPPVVGAKKTRAAVKTTKGKKPLSEKTPTSRPAKQREEVVEIRTDDKARTADKMGVAFTSVGALWFLFWPA